MRRRINSKLPALFSLLIIAAAAALASAESKRPNIIYFYVDDMGWGSIGPNGQQARRDKGLPFVRTPNLDRLARQGVNFTRGYGCHVCSPARSSQQSGFHQGHTFADRNDPNNAKKAMRADDILIGDALSRAGYVTGYWGKWGYGGSKSQTDPVIDNVQTLPTSHGYQHVLAELHHVRAHTFFQPTLWRAPARANAVGGIELVKNSMAKYQASDKYPNSPALQNHKAYPATAYCDDSYAFAALDFVRQQAKNFNANGQPFFGLLAVQIPHAPFGEISALPEWDLAYQDDAWFADLSPQSRQWAAMVTRIDSHFGNILAALEDPDGDGDSSDSIAAETLIVFQSDNGGPAGKNNLEFDANGGLRGTKGKIQEGGIRVPLVMRWTSQINQHSALKAGTNCDRVVDVTDLLPTFCEVAGTQVPLGIDGVSIAPFLQGSKNQRQRDFIIHEAGNGCSIISGDIKLVQPKKGPTEMYNLAKDHAEPHNIAAQHPNRVQEMLTLLKGERVFEPKGFANTYHVWTGKNGGDAASKDNWSDYEYANAGVTYMTDSGAPRLSWIARMENHSQQSNESWATKSLEFLGLEIRGGDTSEATQTLSLSRGVTLNGRNEIRIAKRGQLNVDRGTVISKRRIHIQQGGSLSGNVTLQCDVLNEGTATLKDGASTVEGDFQQADSGNLSFASNDALLKVFGTAKLAGMLTVEFSGADSLADGQQRQVLSAEKGLSGRFKNQGGVVQSSSGKQFKIQYTQNSVSISPLGR